MLKIFVGLIFLRSEVFCFDGQFFSGHRNIRVDLNRQSMFLNPKFDYIVREIKKGDDLNFEWGREDELHNQNSILGMLTMESTTSKQNISIAFSICTIYPENSDEYWAQAVFKKIYHDVEYGWYERLGYPSLCPFEKYGPITSPANISLETKTFVDVSDCNQNKTVYMFLMYINANDRTLVTVSECIYQGVLTCI